MAFYPLLFAAFPILFLFAYNIDEVPATDLVLPLLIAIIGTLTLLLLLRLITKNYNKIAIITSYFLILFFSYGHVRDAISPGAKVALNFNLFLVSLWALLFIAGAFLVIKARRDFSTSTKFLNVVAITLVVISVINIGIYEIKTINLGHEEISEEGSSLGFTNITSTDNSPDIYYIILDMYARDDVLKERLNYDNSEFTNYLANKGFYVATKSCSNYGSTYASLPSSLNMDYLDAEEREAGVSLIPNNKVSRFLKEKGYRYIFVDGGTCWKNMDKYADVYSCTEVFGIKVGDFAYSLCETTLLAPFGRLFSGIYGTNTITQYGANRILYAFNALADIPDIEEPTFVYAHIMCPHPPASFDSDGPKEFTMFGGEEGFYPQGYLGNLTFISKKVKTVVDEIISKSDVPPVIILQGDHGIWYEKGKERDILNAYYLPGKDNRLLYETITPVNSFRVVFNLYFDTDYELLEDVSK